MSKLKDFFQKNDSQEYEFVFGKYDGDLLIEVFKYDYGYVDWIIWKSSFPSYVKEFLADRLQEYQLSQRSCSHTEDSVNKIEVTQ